MLVGIKKTILYARIALHVAFKYAYLIKNPKKYFQFLSRAWTLLKTFYHHKAVKVQNGYKLHLYLPAYPSKSFFYALESKLLRSPPAPITIVFSMTKACGYKCPHCYQRNDEELDIKEELLIETVKKLQDTGVTMFDIEGGEPFLRFPRLLKVVESLDERAEIWVNTTGDNIKPGMLEQLKESGLFGLMISIHSPDPAKHDEFTGISGSFDVACETVELCKKLGLTAAINSVLSEDEIKNGDLDKLMDLSKSLGADFVQLIHPKPAGKWLEQTEKMQKEKVLIEHIRKEHLQFNSYKTKDYPAMAAQVYEEKKESLGCTAGGIDRFYLNASGEVQPCEFLNISFGNVEEDEFDEIFSRMRSYFEQPCTDWLCCTQAEEILNIIKKYDLKQTPIPWEYTQKLVENWDRGEETPLYKKLGIYK